MSGTNIGPMRLMEKWTERDTPGILNGHQTHWPSGGSGRAMSKRGMAKGITGCDRDGIKRKVRGVAIMSIKAKLLAKKSSFRKAAKK